MENTLVLGDIEGRRRGQQRMRRLDGITDSVDVSLSKLREIVKDGRMMWCSPQGHRELDTTEQLNNNIYTVHTHTKKKNSFQISPGIRF